MSKLKLFLENFLIYGVGGVVSKIVPLIMIPFITRLMPNTKYYGLSDLSNTVVSFGSALAIMGMYDAMYRMFFDKEDEGYKKDICSTALFFTLGTSIIIFVAMILSQNLIAQYVFGDTEYSGLVYITAMATMVGATNSIVSAPTRMRNKRKVFLVMNTLSPILSYSVAIPLLLNGHYIVALPIAMVISGLSCEVIFWGLNHEWFSVRRFNFSYLKALCVIAIPLLPNFLIYWIFNSCDRIMIVNILGTGAAGIYSVGSKLGLASQLIYTAFAGGWQYFAFSTMREKNQVESNTKVFEYLGIISFACTVFVFTLCKPIYELLFTGDYIDGYIVSPYLFLAPLLQMLFQIAVSQFLVIKKTWPSIFILFTGAIVNIILNIYLIPFIGIEGAAIATLVGYAVSDIACVLVLEKMKLIVISKKFIASVMILISFIVLWRIELQNYILISFIISCFICLIYAALYRRDLQHLFNSVKRR